MRKLTATQLEIAKKEARAKMIKGNEYDFINRDVALECIDPTTGKPLIDREASDLDRYFAFRNNKVFYDADSSLEANVIYEEAFLFINKHEKRIIRQQDNYNAYGLKYELANPGCEDGIVFRGDTMNSVAAVNKEYIRRKGKKCAELPKPALDLMNLYHTIGNFMILPAKSGIGSINSLRGIGPSKDFFDLYLMAVYNSFLRLEKKDRINDITLEFILWEDGDLIEFMESFLEEFVENGKNGWNNFVKENFFQDFVKKNSWEDFGPPKELWKGHFKAASNGNVLPKTKGQFESFWTNAAAMIRIRSFRIYREIILKDCDSDYFEPVIYNL